MARRRLMPLPDQNVPRAERFDAATPLETTAFQPAPIARVAAEAAGAAALNEVAETLRRARETGRLVLDLPLEAIAPDHLARDRLPVEGEEMAALRESIRTHGQRTPIEVTPLSGALPYGLISGWRRLAALTALHAETGDARFATVQALLRRPETAAAAYVAMVEENEVRVGLSQYERARVAARAAERGVFDSENEALRALFATASRAKRSRIRAFLEIYHALDGTLRFPTFLPERLGLKLVEKLREGRSAAIVAALAAADPQEPEAELACLVRVLAPEARKSDAAAPETIGPGLSLRQKLRRGRLTLTLEGAAVTSDLAAEIRALLEKIAAR